MFSTGGEYLPIVNAANVLSKVVQKTINESCTLSRSFRELDMCDIEYNSKYKFKYCKTRVAYMLTNCHTMDDIRDEYKFTGQTGESDDFGSSPQEIDSFMSRFEEYVMNMASTPIGISDDEGYRTRLPTTASIDSSINSINNSPASYDDSRLLVLQWSS